MCKHCFYQINEMYYLSFSLLLFGSLFYIFAFFQNTTFLLPDKGGDKSFKSADAQAFLQIRDILNWTRISMQADLLKTVSEIWALDVSELSFWQKWWMNDFWSYDRM
jgi:hypothetical protein